MKKSVMNKLSGFQNKIVEMVTFVENTLDEMNDKFYGHSEKWKESEAGERMQDEIDHLENVLYQLNEADDELHELFDVRLIRK